MIWAVEAEEVVVAVHPAMPVTVEDEAGEGVEVGLAVEQQAESLHIHLVCFQNALRLPKHCN